MRVKWCQVLATGSRQIFCLKCRPAPFLTSTSTTAFLTSNSRTRQKNICGKTLELFSFFLLVTSFIKLYQRHNEPQSVLAKVTSLGHITSSYPNLDQIPSAIFDKESTSKSQPNISIQTKLKIQNIDQNLASVFRPRLNFITSTKYQRQNDNQSPASQSISQ